MPVHELLPLGLGVVVDVVPTRHLAERCPQDIVFDEVVGRMQQVGGIALMRRLAINLGSMV